MESAPNQTKEEKEKQRRKRRKEMQKKRQEILYFQMLPKMKMQLWKLIQVKN